MKSYCFAWIASLSQWLIFRMIHGLPRRVRTLWVNVHYLTSRSELDETGHSGGPTWNRTPFTRPKTVCAIHHATGYPPPSETLKDSWIKSFQLLIFFPFSYHISMVLGSWSFLLAVHRLCGVFEGRLNHFLPHWLRTGWQSAISQGKISWNTPPWLGIELGPWGGQTVSYPTELSWLTEAQLG